MGKLLFVLGLALFSCASTEPSERTGEQPHSVGFLLLDGVYNSELMAPYDVFHHTVFHVKPGMRVFTVGRTMDPVTTFEGLRIAPDHHLDNAPQIDVLVVPSAEHNMTTDLEDRRLMTWIAERGQKARFVLSVCDGAFLLAEAGFLEGRQCTTFPGDISAFRRRYPHLAVVEQVSFVADGAAITGVGGARSYEPAMYLVEKLYGKRVAEGVGKGLVIDWRLDDTQHFVAPSSRPMVTDPRSYMPGDTIDPEVAVEDKAGRPVRLVDLVSSDNGDKALVLCIMAGAEGKAVAKRGGLWCEDSYNDLPILRHLLLEYADKGVRFVAVTCPPVYHEQQFGYETGTFLLRQREDPVYQQMRRQFVERTLALREQDVLPPFQAILYDPRFRLLANPAQGEPSVATGPRPQWQGRFKWHLDTQIYGTPTIWVLDGDLEVYGEPFYMNVYESEGRKVRYTVRDISARLDRLLRSRG